jgi:hypothetical protein
MSDPTRRSPAASRAPLAARRFDDATSDFTGSAVWQPHLTLGTQTPIDPDLLEDVLGRMVRAVTDTPQPPAYSPTARRGDPLPAGEYLEPVVARLIGGVR